MNKIKQPKHNKPKQVMWMKRFFRELFFPEKTNQTKDVRNLTIL